MLHTYIPVWLLVVIVALLCAVPLQASEVSLQGEIVGGRFLVPMRGIFETLGAVVDWDGDTRVATITQGNVVIRVYEAPIPDISHIKNMDRFCAVGDLQLQGSAIIMFFAEESSVEDMLGTPEEMKLENKGYIRDPVGIFDLKTMWYPGLRLKYVRELPPPHFTKEKREIFRFKEAEVFKAGIKGPRGIEVGNSLKEVLDKFPAPYQDEKNMRQYGRVDIENGSVNKIEFSDYVPDSPYGIMVHHFNFTVYFLDNRVDRYHIKHIMYDL